MRDRRLYNESADPASPRVLHVVESLDRGAVENWLVRMLRHGRSLGAVLDWTFYCQLDRPGALDEDVRNLGAEVIPSSAPLGEPAAFAAALRAELKRGRYDILHCHHDLVSALYLTASAGLPLRRRIVHAHNADEQLPTGSALKYRLLKEPMRQICLRADRVVGISDHTLDTMLRGRPRRPGRDVVHYYGVDPSPFSPSRGGRAALRHQLGLPAEATVMLFGGRITPEKNPVFAVDVLSELRRLIPGAIGVFAGSGSLEGAVLARAKELGVAGALHMLGWRSDLPAIMGASDLFILPRPEQPMEGFGLAVVEAQLAGLRLLLSTGIPDDPILPGASCRRLPLAAGADAWARAAADLIQRPAPTASDARHALAKSPFDMDHALADLQRLHA